MHKKLNKIFSEFFICQYFLTIGGTCLPIFVIINKYELGFLKLLLNLHLLTFIQLMTKMQDSRTMIYLLLHFTHYVQFLMIF
jgi:hypothetical protein